jgi:hypothetical protein
MRAAHHHHTQLLRHKPLAFVAALSLLLLVYLINHSPVPDQGSSSSSSRGELRAGLQEPLLRHRITTVMKQQGARDGRGAAGCVDGARGMDCNTGSSSSTSQAHLVIVGGGLAGLVAAIQAAYSAESASLPLRITLLEKMGNVGGNSAKV